MVIGGLYGGNMEGSKVFGGRLKKNEEREREIRITFVCGD
jgi:hypothetical protein